VLQVAKTHNGPLTTKAELEDLVGGWNGSEKALHSVLDLEIRFRKYTLTKVKLVCPLFKQRGLSIDQKVKNLTALIESQLELKTLADMEDLTSAILASSETPGEVDAYDEVFQDDEELQDDVIVSNTVEVILYFFCSVKNQKSKPL